MTSSKQRRQGLKPPPKIHAGEPAPASGAEAEHEAPAQPEQEAPERPESPAEAATSAAQEQVLPATSEEAAEASEAAWSEGQEPVTSEEASEAAWSEAPVEAAEAAMSEAPAEAAVSEEQEASVRSSGSPGEGGLAADGPREDLAAHEVEDVEEEPRRVASGVMLSEEIPIDPEDDLRSVEGEASPRLVSIIESLLFSASKPLSVRDLRKVLQETSQHQIQLALRHLLEVTKTRGVMLAQVAGGFQLRTHPDNAVWVQKMLQAKPTRLSRTQIETLAIVAYRQPVTRPEIDDIRGVDSGAVLRSLLERELVQIVGKKDEPGRPLLYGTTVRFLEFFNLRGLRDLPTLRDFRDLSEESKATLRERLGDLQIAEALGQGVLGFPGEEGGETGAGEASSAEDPDASSGAGDVDPLGAPSEPRMGEGAEPEAGAEPEVEAREGDGEGAEPEDGEDGEGAEPEVEAREGAEPEVREEDVASVEREVEVRAEEAAGAEREIEGRDVAGEVEGQDDADAEREIEAQGDAAPEPAEDEGDAPEAADEGSVAKDDPESGAVLPGAPERAPAEGDPPEES